MTWSTESSWDRIPSPKLCTGTGSGVTVVYVHQRGIKQLEKNVVPLLQVKLPQIDLSTSNPR